MEHPREILSFLAARLAAGERAALVTITAVAGASMRNPGTHMGVTGSGDYAGSLSGGCIEAAVVAEAVAAMADGAPRLLHYGAGSPFIDIRLPCGGALHVLIKPMTDSAEIDSALAAFERRQEAALTLAMPDGRSLTVTHAPPLRVALYGDGAATARLAELARMMGADAAVLTEPDGAATLTGDRWTAMALLFHEHDAEVRLLERLLDQPALLIGAMGSRATHAARVERLRALGMPDDQIDRIKAPIGLIHSSRDPGTLALSAFVEMVEAYNRAEPTRVEITG